MMIYWKIPRKIPDPAIIPSSNLQSRSKLQDRYQMQDHGRFLTLDVLSELCLPMKAVAEVITCDDLQIFFCQFSTAPVYTL